MTKSAEKTLLSLFEAAVEAANPLHCVAPHLPPPPEGKIVVIGAGKAAASMAKAVEIAWPEQESSGLVLTPYGHGMDCRHIEVIEAAHPVPDAAGQEAAGQMLERVAGLDAKDWVLCLISGGGSALLVQPAPGIRLEDKQSINRALLRSGANIHEINCVRKHLSAIKGGRLAMACAPAQVLSLMISDVPGDDASVIASGLTVADPTTSGDAMNILKRYQVDIPAPVLAHLRKPESETPKPGDSCFSRCENRVIATTQDAMSAAALRAEELGYTPCILGDLEGEAREVARMHAGIVKQVRQFEQPFSTPCALISGGETTVTLASDHGRGGRNAEFLLSLAIALDGVEGVYALACDTDGIDGVEDNAGAMLFPDSLSKANKAGIDAEKALFGHDSYAFFKACDALVSTGPTRTNVNDFRVILID